LTLFGRLKATSGTFNQIQTLKKGLPNVCVPTFQLDDDPGYAGRRNFYKVEKWSSEAHPERATLRADNLAAKNVGGTSETTPVMVGGGQWP